MPQLSLITSKVHLIEVEKKEILSKLNQASSDIALLKSNKKALEDKDVMSKGEIKFSIQNEQ